MICGLSSWLSGNMMEFPLREIQLYVEIFPTIDFTHIFFKQHLVLKYSTHLLMMPWRQIHLFLPAWEWKLPQIPSADMLAHSHSHWSLVRKKKTFIHIVNSKHLVQPQYKKNVIKWMEIVWHQQSNKSLWNVLKVFYTQTNIEQMRI